MIPRVKGTQDFIDCTLFNFIIDSVKKHLITYHFSEIQTPILELVDLFRRSLGLYTDVVSKEMFIIDSRQEGVKTASVYAQKAQHPPCVHLMNTISKQSMESFFLWSNVSL